MLTVLVTRAIPDEARQLLERDFRLVIPSTELPIAPDVLRREIAEADALLCLLTDRISDEVMAAAPKLRIIANYAVGTDNIDLEAARQRGIWVTNTPGVLTQATAELTWALILATARRVVEGDALCRGGDFKGWAPLLLCGGELGGKTLGLVGTGRIGTAVALIGFGFGMRVLYLDPKPSILLDTFDAKQADLPTLLAESDVLSLHCPLTPETKHLIGAAELAVMKRTAYLINTSRGDVVVEDALIAALRDGMIAGAGLDVYTGEPNINPALRELPNAVLLPHIGSATTATRLKMGQMCVAAIQDVLEGREPENVVVRGR